MLRRNVVLVLVFALIVVLASFGVSAANTLSAKVVLPDGNGAPYATVTVGDKVFKTDSNGAVEITYENESKATIKWLEIEAEVTLSAKMKLPNRLYYGAPYDEIDWVLNGPDTWEIDSNVIRNEGGQNNESQIFIDDGLDNFVIRTKFSASAPSQWFMLRFFMRASAPGFNGYGINFAVNPADRTFAARFEGAWDKYEKLAKDLFIYSAVPQNKPFEFVGFLKDEHIVVYVRAEDQREYTKILDIEDDSADAYYDGGIGILNSFTTVEITEFSVFKF